MAPIGATTYAMSLKVGNGLVFKTQAQNYEDAYFYFRKLKQLTKEEFDKIFIVTIIEIKTRN